MAMHAGVGLTKIVFIVGAGYTGTLLFKNGKLSDVIGEPQNLVKSYEKTGESDGGDSDVIAVQEMSEHLGIRLLNERLNDPTMQDSLDSIFPKDNPKNTRFAINFFTSIGLGGITENLREYLKNMPRLIMQQQKPVSESDDESGSSGSGSESSSSSSDDSDSESDDSRRKRRRRR